MASFSNLTPTKVTAFESYQAKSLNKLGLELAACNILTRVKGLLIKKKKMRVYETITFLTRSGNIYTAEIEDRRRNVRDIDFPAEWLTEI